MRILGVILLSLLGCSYASAQDFIYKPLNPSFGGNSFNSAHLLGLADRQNRFKETPGSLGANAPSDSDQFQRQIQSAILGRVSAEIADQILGEQAADSGRFTIDSTVISFEKINGIVSIEISDGISGGSTVIEIPAPVF